MNTKIARLAALVAALFTAPAMASAVPVGTLITATASGATTGLLGSDHLYADEPGTGTTHLSDGITDPEYLTKDYAVFADFFSDGSVQFTGNTTDGLLPGSYTLRFSFAGLSEDITSFVLTDTSHVRSGDIAPLVIDGKTISISFTDLVFDDVFVPFTAQLGLSPAAATVPEPSSLALISLCLGLMVVRQRRSHA